YRPLDSGTGCGFLPRPVFAYCRCGRLLRDHTDIRGLDPQHFYMTAQPRRATEPAAEPSAAEAQPAPDPSPGPGGIGPAGPNTSGFHSAAVPQRHPVDSNPTGKRLTLLSLTALGIVYGDIGTSPLYALQQCFMAKEHAVAVTTENVYGVLSLIVWLLILVVAIKYIVFIMRADNRGEGGI